MYIIQACADAVSNRRNIAEVASIPEAACLAESYFIKSNVHEVRVIGSNGRVVIDNSNKTNPIECLWVKG